MDLAMRPVDVVILTKNSERMLRACVRSIYQNIPVNRLIVIDGYSSDRTLEILSSFQKEHGNVKLIRTYGTRAEARQRGIQEVETDWFVFVDSDVVLCKNWLARASRSIKEDVGAVWGIEVWASLEKTTMLKMFLWVTRKIFEIRGGTHDTLIRRKAIEGMRIPANLHVFEDAYIKEWMVKRGYDVVACYDPHCLHYRANEVWTLRGSLNLIVEAVRFGSFKLIARLLLAYGFYAAYSIHQMMGSRP